MTNEKLFHVGVKGLIENKDGKILLLLAPGWAKNNTVAHWDIPGGRVSEGEDVLITLRREIEEETGVRELIDSEFFTAIVSNHEIPLGDGRNAGLLLMVYKVKVPDSVEIVISKEHETYAWVDKEATAKRLANKYPKEFTDMLKA